ncbi:MAG: hypothetical protein KC431_04295 [Myxococcales bacterium]|nr:hypothetical protein [Myxococcales bacterium]
MVALEVATEHPPGQQHRSLTAEDGANDRSCHALGPIEPADIGEELTEAVDPATRYG